jgi:hypothetical protein
MSGGGCACVGVGASMWNDRHGVQRGQNAGCTHLFESKGVL